MALIQLKSETLENSIGVLMNKCNAEVLEAVTPLAQMIKNSGDDNKQLNDLLELAKKFQSQFNALTEGTEKFVAEAKGLIDLSEFLDKRKSIGEVADRDTGFEVGKLNTQAMVQ